LSMPGRGYTIWRKEADGNWKCVVDIWNNPPAH
jgi:ketosteroid isomerase-like protein